MRISRPAVALVCIAVLGAVVAAMVVQALGFNESARVGPLVVGIPTVVFIALQLGRDVLRLLRGDTTVGTTSEEEQDRYRQVLEADDEPAEDGTARQAAIEDRRTSAAGALLWVGALALLIWLVGMLTAIPVFIAAFMRLFGGERWTTIAGYVVGTTVVVYLFFAVVLEVRLYAGLLGGMLPWT